MNKSKQRIKYLVADYLSANVAWLLLNILRFYELAQYEGFNTPAQFFLNGHVLFVQLLVPFFWLLLYYFSGYYNQPFGKSRINELFMTFVSSLLGVVFIFFVVILNDLPQSFQLYYLFFFSYLLMQFFLTYLVRFQITTHALRKMRRREWSLGVLIIHVVTNYEKAEADLLRLGYRVVGVVGLSAAGEERMRCLDEIDRLMQQARVDEFVLVADSMNDEECVQMLYSLYHYKRPIKMWSERSNPLASQSVKTIHGIPLVDLTNNNFSEAEKNIKLVSDKVISLLFLLLFSPLYVYLAFRVKRSSPGPVFFKQERIGHMGRPFYIYKFRTMYVGAGAETPQLTSKEDPRVTPYGRMLRKYRLDELPQFWNVLKGDMSIVGPRPEQRYYIDLIVKRAPYYYLLHNVRPGITSWGMVKYGYAENVDMMIERLKFDLLYYENMSLALDLMILVYTVRIVFTGKGI